MQQNAETTEFYDERVSKDDRFSYTIYKTVSDPLWHVDCWQSEENKWHKQFPDKEKALAEFNRFD